MKPLPKFLLAIVLLTVASVGWAKEECPEGTTQTYKGCESDKEDAVDANVQKLLKTKSCRKCDLTDANLQQANLKDAKLEYADLTRANLTGADLTGANLTGAGFSYAVLVRVNLSGAKLGSAYLLYADLTEANLSGAKYVYSATFRRAKFCNTVMDDGAINNSGCSAIVEKTVEESSVSVASTETTMSEENVAEPTQTTEPTQTADTSALDLAFWQSIQDSEDPDMFRAYLRKFPQGIYADLAQINLNKPSGTTEAIASAIPDLNYGRYHALVIGNNDYDYLSDLKTAINDAEGVASLLKEDYGFEVSLLKNATRAETVTALAKFRRTVSANDSLLIYYAGHGHLDEAADEGYWLPVDSSPDDPGNWLQNDTIVAQVRAMDAKHVMIVADSCFSGTLTRAIKIELRTPSDLQKIIQKKARTALTSGGLEPVLDSRGGAHSVFAKSFISLLEENPGVLDAHQLFSSLRTQVALNSSQIPEYGNIHEAGHDGGDFLFVKTAKISVESVAASTVETPEAAPNNAAEVAFWQSIEDSDDPEMLKAYLEEYPNGKFEKLAKLKLKKLESTVETIAEEPKATEKIVIEQPVAEEPKEVETTVKAEESKEAGCPEGTKQTYKGCEDSAEVATDRDARRTEAEATALAIAEGAGAASGTDTGTDTESGTNTGTDTEDVRDMAACASAKRAFTPVDRKLDRLLEIFGKEEWALAGTGKTTSKAYRKANQAYNALFRGAWEAALNVQKCACWWEFNCNSSSDPYCRC